MQTMTRRRALTVLGGGAIAAAAAVTGATAQPAVAVAWRQPSGRWAEGVPTAADWPLLAAARWRGAWSADGAYAPGDLVETADALWLARQAAPSAPSVAGPGWLRLGLAC